METKKLPPSRWKVLFTCACAALGWLSILLFFVALALGLSGAKQIAGVLVLSIFPMLFIGGIGYLIPAVLLRCSHCGYKFLKNPKGLGPTDFAYSANCPRLPGINPWAYQIGRCLATGQIKCIHCGEEVFDRTSETTAQQNGRA